MLDGGKDAGNVGHAVQNNRCGYGLPAVSLCSEHARVVSGIGRRTPMPTKERHLLAMWPGCSRSICFRATLQGVRLLAPREPLAPSLSRWFLVREWPLQLVAR